MVRLSDWAGQCMITRALSECPSQRFLVNLSSLDLHLVITSSFFSSLSSSLLLLSPSSLSPNLFFSLSHPPLASHMNCPLLLNMKKEAIIPAFSQIPATFLPPQTEPAMPGDDVEGDRMWVCDVIPEILRWLTLNPTLQKCFFFPKMINALIV